MNITTSLSICFNDNKIFTNSFNNITFLFVLKACFTKYALHIFLFNHTKIICYILARTSYFAYVLNTIFETKPHFGIQKNICSICVLRLPIKSKARYITSIRRAVFDSIKASIAALISTCFCVKESILITNRIITEHCKAKVVNCCLAI